MKILICGSRTYSNKYLIKKTILYYDKDDTVIIVGGARGADSIGEYIARQFEYPVEVYPADWEKYGKAGGMIRNQEMLDIGKPDVVYAFYTDINNKSRGTMNMVKIARKAGIKVVELT